MTGKFSDVMNKTAGNAKEPEPLPAGHYDFSIKTYESGESSKKKTPQVKFECLPYLAHEDVEEDDLPENWNEKPLYITFYMTDDALYRFDSFLQDTLGLSLEGRAYAEVVGDAVNGQFTGEITHTAPQPGSQRKNPYANIGTTSKLA
jgi:hypothetical protein